MDDSILSLFFSPFGRIGRLKWWLLQMVAVLFIISGIVSYVYTKSFSGILFFCSLGLWFNISSTHKRLHDLGFNSGILRVAFLPGVNFILLIWIGFFPGDKYDNEYGPGSINAEDIDEHLRKILGEEGYQVAKAAGGLPQNDTEARQDIPPPSKVWSTGNKTASRAPQPPPPPAPQVLRPSISTLRNQPTVFGRRQ